MNSDDNNLFYKFFDYVLTNTFNSLFVNGPLSVLPDWLQILLEILIGLIFVAILFLTFIYFATGLYKKHSIKSLIEEIKSRWRENKDRAINTADWNVGLGSLGGMLSFFIHNEWHLMGLPMIIPAILFLPPSYKYLQKKFKINIPLYVKYIIFILAGIIGGLIAKYYYKIP